MQVDERRLIRLGGTRNLRDLGGYLTVDGRRTRWRTVFRSDCLDQLHPAGQEWLLQAGLRTIIDLRDGQEVAANPNVFARSTHIRYRRLPVWDEPPLPGQAVDIREGYIHELDLLGNRLCRVLRALLEPDALPALIHCAAGKDRTGIVVALLLGAVGVPDQTIAEDYALSSVCLGLDDIFEASPERMLKTLAHLEQRFGGLRRYLIEHGLVPDQIDQLRELLTEPVST